MPKNIIELIGAGFKSLWQNLIILLPLIFQSIAQMILMIISIILFENVLKIPLLDYALNKISEAEFQQVFISTFSSPTVIMQGIALFLLIFLGFLVITAYFNSGIIGMMDYYLKFNKKPSLRQMHEYGKKFFWRYLFLELLINLFLIIAVAISVGLAFVNFWLTIFAVIFFIACLILYAFMVLSPLIMIVKDYGVFLSLKKSLILTKNNFWALLGIAALYSAADMLSLISVDFIQIIFTLIFYFLINPSVLFSLVLFVQERQD